LHWLTYGYMMPVKKSLTSTNVMEYLISWLTVSELV
jgi:hypothetical protein